MDNLVSVIIPVYNPGKYLYKCLDSIINQTYKNLEIILIDDGSTDGSSAVCDEYAKKDVRIKVIHQMNLGVSTARNKGIDIATGDYIHFPDSDDYLELDTYEYCLNLAIKEKCEIVNFEHFVSYSDKEFPHTYNESFYGLHNTYDSLYKLANGLQFASNKLIERRLIFGKNREDIIKFREDIFRGEDTLFVAQIIERANNIWFDKRPLYHYVQTENSACRGVFRPTQLTVLKTYEAFKSIYGKYPKIWECYLIHRQHCLIEIYYDMWCDSSNYSDALKNLYNILLMNYSNIKKNNVSKKELLKFIIFRISPKFYCYLHKMELFIHDLRL